MHENFDINFKKYTSNAVKCQKRYSKWVIKMNDSKIIFQHKKSFTQQKHTHHNKVIYIFHVFC